MQQALAIEMLSSANKSYSDHEVWADLGCGTGTFTLALAHLLGEDSHIIAIDKDRHSLQKIPDGLRTVTITKKDADFLNEEFIPENLDGILMANSLHYVRTQKDFIKTIQHFLKPDGCFLIVEYDTNISNPWIPYPVNFEKLKKLFATTDFSDVRKINEKPSRYNRANLYSAIIQKTSSG